MLRVRVCGGLEVEVHGRPVPDALVGGRQGRLVLAYLVRERRRAVRREELAELLWPDRLPESWTASLSAVVSRLRRLLTEAGLDGSQAITSVAGAYQLVLPPDAVVDLEELEAAVREAEAAAEAGDAPTAVAAAGRAEGIGAQGFLADDCAWVDRQREAVRDLRVRAALARSTAQLGAGAAARAVDAARDALALDETREAAYRLLMRGLASVGERAEALRAWERCRTTLVEELGVDPSPETEAVYLEVLGARAAAAAADPPGPAAATTATALPTGVVTFLLTDIVESSALWDVAPEAMAVALERHDSLVAQVVAAGHGTLLKSKLEGDATVSVFARASDGAAAALALRRAIDGEPWPEGARLRLRMAMHTGEAFERGGDYFGPALNRAARLRSLAGPGEVLLSQAVTELVRDHLPAGGTLRDLGHRDLRGLSRGENVYALVTAEDDPGPGSRPAAGPSADVFAPPALPAALAGTGPFVGRGDELHKLVELWDRTAASSLGAVFIGGEPGVGKSRLAAEVAGRAHDGGAIVLHGRCDEELAAPLQPFIEALRTLVPALGRDRTGAVRGVDELARVVPELAEQLPDRAPTVRADPDTERLALFDAVTNLLRAASVEAPVLLVLDDLHWAGKTTLSLLRHVLRGAKDARLLVVGTYRDTELARTHPLAETLADLRRDANATRVSLGGLGAEDIEDYLAAVGIDDRALGRELAEVTSGNPFFLIEVLRHVEETGGAWSPGNLPEGVREATGRRLSRLSEATNQALSVAAVVGASFDLDLVEQAHGRDLVDEMAEACRAGLVDEEPGSIGRFRFAHALVRQVLLAELVTVKRVRLHRTIAGLLEATPAGDDPDARLADLAHHWSECASLGDAGKAVDACRRAADRAMERLAYEEAGDLYGMALQVLEAADAADVDVRAELHLARCDALLTAGDVTGARSAIDALEGVSHGSERLAAWYTTYEGLLAVLAEPDRLTEIVQSIGAAAGAMREIGDLRGEARAHYVHATALERLGQIGAAERALDAALAAARSADDRRLADSILAEAPPAALWGPSSVTRASGRCLDVVRVLRINDGAPAVESVALRCQAVLEALRGRTDAARKMIGSARRTVERLGLTHRQLETDVMAGFIELLAGDAPEAERLLRGAYHGLRERGLGGEAAQAAAFLGRALLLQDRVEEADEVAAEAQHLAGSDLKAGIAWRDVRAECAARQGDAAGALGLANEAVDLAAATDALLLVADARLTLATVLRATGDPAGAAAEARRAVEACEAKGASALAARARGVGPPHEVGADAGPTPAARGAASVPKGDLPNVEVLQRFVDAVNRHDWDALTAALAPGFELVDRRRTVAAPTSIDPIADYRLLFSLTDFRVERDVLGADGARRFLVRDVMWVRDGSVAEAEVESLKVLDFDDEGRMVRQTSFAPDDLEAASAELHSADHEVRETLASRTARQLASAMNAHDWDGVTELIAPAVQFFDRRGTVTVPDSSDLLEVYRFLFTMDDWRVDRTILRTHGEHRALHHDVVWFRIGQVPDGEVEVIEVLDVDAMGRVTRVSSFGGTDLAAAEAELTAVDPVPAPLEGQHVEGGRADVRGFRRIGELPQPNAAWRAQERLKDAQNADDIEALYALLSPHFTHHERRTAARLDLEGDAARQPLQEGAALTELRLENRLLAVRGDRLALVEGTALFRDGATGTAELTLLVVVESDDDGRLLRRVLFDGAAFDEALAELESRYREQQGGPRAPDPNLAFRAVQRLEAAVGAHHIDRVRGTLSPDFTFLDRRAGQGMLAGVHGEQAQSITVAGMDDGVRMTNRLLAVRGEHLALVERQNTAPDGAGGPAESTVTVVEVDADGRLLRHVVFDPSAVDEATEELEARYRSGERPPFGNLAWAVARRWLAAYNAGDRRALVDLHTPDYVYIDHRSGVTDLATAGDDAFAQYDVALSMAELRLDHRLVTTRGEAFALFTLHLTFRDGATGPAEVDCIVVFEVDEDGAVTSTVAFDADALPDALAELDRRAASVRPNTAWEQALRQNATLDARDWDAFAATIHPDHEYLDRRRAMRPPEGASPLSPYETMFSLDEWEFRRTLLATRGRRLVLVRQDCYFRDGAAGQAQGIGIAVLEVADDGRFLREIPFELEDLDDALAELEARCEAGRRAAPARNTGRRAVHSAGPALDRRETGLQERERPPKDPLAIPRTLAARSVEQAGWTLVAAIGEHVCLHQTGSGTIVHEVDDDGEVLAALSFAPDARRDAFVELVRRGCARLRLPDGATRMALAATRGDVEAMIACVPEGFSIEEHRRLPSSGWRGRTDMGSLLHSFDDLTADHLLEVRRIDVPHLGSAVALSVIWRSGTTDEGVAFESPYVSVVSCDEAGRLADVALYEVDDIELARARLAERSGVGPSPADPLAIPPNLAASSVAQPGWMLLGAHGEHLCLHDDGARLVLHEVDDAGEVVAFLAFDRSDRRGAFDELVRRSFSRCGVPAPTRSMSEAMHARDAAALRRCMSAGCVIEDHRHLRVVPLQRADDYVAAFELAMDLAPDCCVEVARLVTCEPWGVVTLSRLTGTMADSGSLEVATLACSVWDDSGRTRLIALYEPDDLSLAIERLAQAAPA